MSSPKELLVFECAVEAGWLANEYGFGLIVLFVEICTFDIEGFELECVLSGSC